MHYESRCAPGREPPYQKLILDWARPAIEGGACHYAAFAPRLAPAADPGDLRRPLSLAPAAKIHSIETKVFQKEVEPGVTPPTISG
ncbi:hypothetical protein Lfu02_31760 [Longispora fulva]|nr:hypothetical protein Lfu02_31760 [Longispora fulva]